MSLRLLLESNTATDRVSSLFFGDVALLPDAFKKFDINSFKLLTFAESRSIVNLSPERKIVSLGNISTFTIVWSKIPFKYLKLLGDIITLALSNSY